MGKLDGKVAFISGAARGQGRSHAVKLASEGATIIAFDICGPIEGLPYDHSTPEDLEQTVRLVEEVGGKILARQADVRDLAAMKRIVDEGVEQFGRLDIIVANAGILTFGELAEMQPEQFDQLIDVNMTGVWKTVRAGVQHIIDGGNGGSVVLTCSTAGFYAYDHIGHYVVAKHGVVGLTKTLAKELGKYNIRVNAVNPTNTRTTMLNNPGTRKMWRDDLEDPQIEDMDEVWRSVHVLPVPCLEPEDVSNVVLFLTSDDARYVTGSQYNVDAGMLVK